MQNFSSKNKIIKRKINEKCATTAALDVLSSQIQEPSMTSLILWNITKALTKNPHLDLKRAIKAAQDRLERDECDLSVANSKSPDEQHFVCAFLAWQQLGHANGDSLYEFIKSQTEGTLQSCIAANKTPKGLIPSPSTSIKIHCSNDLNASEDIDTASFGAYSRGPVIKLPVETKIVMRCETNKNQPMAAATTSKIEAACCMESACTERLTAMDAATAELRARVAKLAQREGQRVILVERAEAAWGELERGYQRRLALAEHKELDINRQIQKSIEDRNANRSECTELAKKLQEAGDATNKEQDILKEVNKELCSRACFRLNLSAEVAGAEAALTDIQCKVVQLDRDLQFKEEQARRRLLTIESETESARVLTHEAERALRAELAGLHQQIEQLAVLLLQEDEVNKRIKAELEQLREEKRGMIEDLDGCKSLCDSKMQAKFDEINKKREQLEKLRDKVIECQCKIPVDASVSVKRTASLAALCKCAPEDRFLDSCSCTSLRGSLISNLLADLFTGLQAQLGGEGLQMPCQLLKCLEDKHNWDRSSVVKNNLQNYFSKLLVGELDIAIATSIENYHAKWIGASCADEAKMTPDPKDDLKEGWEQRALERRAQKLATKLAEQLFEERAEELTKQAKQIVTSGPPPCECGKDQKRSEHASVLSCMTTMKTPFVAQAYSPNQSGAKASGWELTQQDVIDLKLQIEDLKKKTIRKEDLKLVEEKIAELAKNNLVPENEITITKDIENSQEKKQKIHNTIRHINIHEVPKCSSCCKSTCGRKKLNDAKCTRKYCINEKPTKQPKKYDHHQSYAVNLCLCEPAKANKALGFTPLKPDIKPSLKHKTSKEIIHGSSSVKNTTPININFTEFKERQNLNPSYSRKYKCFHEIPSTTSLDNLLATVTKWKNDLRDPQEKIMHNTKSTIVSKTFLDKNSKHMFKSKYKNNATVSFHYENKGNERKETNEIGTVINNNPMFNYHQPFNTASIYLGAVNLDKSNDIACKTVNTADYNIKRERHEVKNIRDLKKVKVLNEHLYGNFKDTDHLDILINSPMIKKPEKIQVKPEKKQTNKTELMTNKTPAIKNETVQTSLLSKETNIMTTMENNETDKSTQNLDYDIKFLGVTLIDTCLEDHQIKQAENTNCNKKTIPKIFRQSFHKQQFTNLSNRETKLECNNLNVSNQQKCNLRSAEYVNNLQEQCVCCNNNKDSSKDLEENAFQLLTDHLKQKLRELKTCSCEASCMLPEEEEKIYTTILKKVRQVISNCANEFKCTEPDGSWKRAYGLLKEYLKMKIKRIQGFPPTNKKSQEVLPDILDKVCNLIENDFQRLKEICKCNKRNKSLKGNTNMALLCDTSELPEKDTNIFSDKYSNSTLPLHRVELIKPLINIQNMSCQVYPNLWMKTKSCEAITETKTNAPLLESSQAKQSSITSLLLKETISAQVTPDLGKETKSCDIMEITHKSNTASKSCDIMDINVKSEHTTSTNYVIAQSEPPGQFENYSDTCRYQEYIHNDLLKICRNKELLLNLYADVLINYDVIGSHKKPANQNFNVGFVNSLPNLNKLHLLKKVTTTKQQISNNSEARVKEPYFGCTIPCTCSNNASACICIKSLIHNYNYDIINDWVQFFTSKNNNIKEWSYIMDSSKHIRPLDNKPFSHITEYFKDGNGITNEFQSETNVEKKENVVLVVSKQMFNVICANQSVDEEDMDIETDTKSKRILECNKSPNSMPSESTEEITSSTKSNKKMNTRSENLTTIDTETISQKCCDKVPICHVKMLVKNIERNLMESRCTCDSISKICPLHSRKIT